MNDKLLKLAQKLKEKEDKKKVVVEKYKDLNKKKKLTQEQRLDRIEELLWIGIE